VRFFLANSYLIETISRRVWYRWIIYIKRLNCFISWLQ